jgi:hypothetical protein
MSSLLATRGSSGTSVYAASKAGLLGEINMNRLLDVAHCFSRLISASPSRADIVTCCGIREIQHPSQRSGAWLHRHPDDKLYVYPAFRFYPCLSLQLMYISSPAKSAGRSPKNTP